MNRSKFSWLGKGVIVFLSISLLAIPVLAQSTQEQEQPAQVVSDEEQKEPEKPLSDEERRTGSGLVIRY